MLSSIRAVHRLLLATCSLLRSGSVNAMLLPLQARLASGSAASCSFSTRATTTTPLRSTLSRLSSFAAAALPPQTCFSSPLLLCRTLSSFSSSYKKSPGIRIRLAAAAARGKVDASPTTENAAAAVSSSSQPPPPPPAQPAAVPRRTVEQIVKRITRADVALQFARSGGAGGQNVNKVNTKADLRLNLDTTEWLEPELVDAVKRAEKKRINKEGELVVTSTASRSQAANVDDALAKLQAILDTAAKTLIPPEVDPEKAKQIEKALKIGNEVRLDLKKKKADKKKDRRASIDW